MHKTQGSSSGDRPPACTTLSQPVHLDKWKGWGWWRRWCCRWWAPGCNRGVGLGRTAASPSGRRSLGWPAFRWPSIFMYFFSYSFHTRWKSRYGSHTQTRCTAAPQDKQDRGIWALLQVYCEHLIAGFFFPFNVPLFLLHSARIGSWWSLLWLIFTTLN